jgi:hypothetical protein
LVLTLAFTRLSELSMLDEEFERERLEVWLVLTLAFTRLSELSIEDDELESERLEV